MSRPDESARIEAHAERFPESVPGVDEIAAGLRKRSFSLAHHGEHRRVVFVDSAEAAVLAAADARTQEIADALRDHGMVSSDYIEAFGYPAAAAFVARRFPNGGTHE